VALFAPMVASAQSSPARDFKTLFETAQRLGNETELRGDISDRLGFGEDLLPIKDLVVTTNGVQHAINAFVVGKRSYILFDSHLYAPEIYIFVKSVDGTLVAGIHGRQYQPVTNTTDMTQGDAAPVIGEEEAFWFRWLAESAKAPAPAK
jgi:hypothetical protein